MTMNDYANQQYADYLRNQSARVGALHGQYRAPTLSDLLDRIAWSAAEVESRKRAVEDARMLISEAENDLHSSVLGLFIGAKIRRAKMDRESLAFSEHKLEEARAALDAAKAAALAMAGKQSEAE